RSPPRSLANHLVARRTAPRRGCLWPFRSNYRPVSLTRYSPTPPLRPPGGLLKGKLRVRVVSVISSIVNSRTGNTFSRRTFIVEPVRSHDHPLSPFVRKKPGAPDA